jgi:hypothetical protein
VVSVANQLLVRLEDSLSEVLNELNPNISTSQDEEGNIQRKFTGNAAASSSSTKNSNKSSHIDLSATPSSYIVSKESIQGLSGGGGGGGDVKTSSSEKILLSLLKHTSKLRIELRDKQQAAKRDAV